MDGYHAFMAIPVELGALGRRIFYTAGGYKYVQAGEGACFLTIPERCDLRPLYTGWFSDFGQLSGAQGEAVGYGADGDAVLGLDVRRLRSVSLQRRDALARRSSA